LRSRIELPLSRRKPTRSPPKNFIIFCEGKNTEPLYFEALKRHLKSALIEIKTEAAVGTPYTIAQAAIKLAKSTGLNTKRRDRLNSFERGDEVWAVFDRDEHPRFQEAVNLCGQHRVGVARSNPCFELWLILHHADFDRADGRHEVQKHLSKLCPEYSPEKGKTPKCESFIGLVEDAEKRAERQMVRRTKERADHEAPSTTVHYLTRSIRNAAVRR
jgi:hypothetical protein